MLLLAILVILQAVYQMICGFLIFGGVLFLLPAILIMNLFGVHVFSPDASVYDALTDSWIVWIGSLICWIALPTLFFSVCLKLEADQHRGATSGGLDTPTARMFERMENSKRNMYPPRPDAVR